MQSVMKSSNGLKLQVQIKQLAIDRDRPITTSCDNITLLLVFMPFVTPP